MRELLNAIKAEFSMASGGFTGAYVVPDLTWLPMSVALPVLLIKDGGTEFDYPDQASVQRTMRVHLAVYRQISADDSSEVGGADGVLTLIDSVRNRLVYNRLNLPGIESALAVETSESEVVGDQSTGFMQRMGLTMQYIQWEDK